MMRNACSAALLLTLAACGPNGCSDKPQIVYKSIEECQKEQTAEKCEQAFSKAQEEHVKTAPRYDNLDNCVATYGPGACTVHHDNGGDFFIPFMTGIIAGHILSSSNPPQPVYTAPGGYVYSGPNKVGTYNYENNNSGSNRVGSINIDKSPPPPSTVNRGGFGGSASKTPNPSPSSTTTTTPSTNLSRGGFGAAASTPVIPMPAIREPSSGSVSTGTVTTTPSRSASPTAPSTASRGGFGGSAASHGTSSGG